MKHDEFFRKHPVFTGEELAKHLSSRGEVGKRAQEALLAYHRKTGRVVQVRRGLYAVIPAGANTDSYPVDPFLVAAKLTMDAVLSHHTALEYHGRAYSVQEHFTYSAFRPLRPLTFRSHVFRGAKFPQALRRAGKESFGVSTSERAGMDLRVTSLERTLVDVLDRPDLSGSWEEIWRSLESVEFFDLDQVVEYALLLGNATTGAKVGFFLGQHRDPLMIEDRHLKALHDLRPRQPHYLDRAKRKSGRLVSEWNLIVPREVFARAWGEVL
ncbi:MAG: type IV toxin-antitoxin system AbiEi family antitoxin domain-containing protein [Proteobacteria bacterium]|nr:type IV toxin-antitoxin system AbiEi family antitoxin domain-containing protein [Pseudomonadota bacterium]